MDYTAKERDLIALDNVAEFTYKMKLMVTDGFNFSRPQQKYAEKLIKTFGESVYNKIKEDFYSENRRQKHLAMLEEKGITCVTIFSDNYPERLRTINTPPAVLYCKGDISLLKTRMFTVVGSRAATPRVLKDSSQIAGQISQHFTVVTGLADGVDSAAAEGVLFYDAKVIGVLAFGFDYVYPSANAQLFKRVEKTGLLITENLPDVQPRKYLFPVRNRILAGISEGTLVTAAAAKSGACITAEYAMQYGRDVFCFPYSLGVPSGEGCNKLIKKGAYLTENILDIFGVFGLDFNSPAPPDFTDREKRIMEIIRSEGEAHISKLAHDMGCAPFELIADLSALEVKRAIVKLGGNRYAII